ncbi:MAG: hypothetical protein WA435_03650, partial [Gallionellaceae bacterium]
KPFDSALRATLRANGLLTNWVTFPKPFVLSVAGVASEVEASKLQDLGLFPGAANAAFQP